MRCRRCKAMFNYEEHEGICPKCAAYNRPDGRSDMELFDDKYAGEEAAYQKRQGELQHQMLHQKYDGDRNVHTQEPDIFKQESASGNKKVKKKRNPLLIVGAAILIMFAACAALAAVVYITKKAAGLGEVKVEEIITGEVQLAPGEFADIGAMHIAFLKAREVTSPQIEALMPEGKKLIAVTEKVDFSQSSDADSDFYTYTEPFVSNGGAFQKPLPKYEIEDITAGLKLNLLESAYDVKRELYEEVRENEGELLYVVDEDLTQTTLYIADWGGGAERDVPLTYYKVNLQVEQAGQGGEADD